MTDEKSSQKALEIIMLQRAKQQAYHLLAQQAVSNQSHYIEKSWEAREILTALTDMALATGLLGHDDVDVYGIQLVDTGEKGEA